MVSSPGRWVLVLVTLAVATPVARAATSADVPADQFMLTTTNVSATGISLAVGPGLRLWLTDHLAVGYAARLRLTFFSGAVGALSTPPSNDNAGASSTLLAFDGAFQILGVF